MYCFLFTIIGVILIYIIFFKDEGWNNVEMVYDGKALTARIRSVSPDGTGVEEKDTKILSGIGKIKIFLQLSGMEKKYKA